VKNLILMRHGSPAPQAAGGTDFDRPLTPQGEREARMQGSFLREAGIKLDVIATSTAVRARTTAEQLAAALVRAPALTPEESLYNAPGEVLLDYMQRLPERASTVLLIAHMPGVAELLALLGSDPQDMAVNFSPCTLVGVSLERTLHWREAAPGCGVVEWLLPPLFAH
jgi:phosphohistidine phosphatase